MNVMVAKVSKVYRERKKLSPQQAKLQSVQLAYPLAGHLCRELVERRECET